jgi:hypothetical protein
MPMKTRILVTAVLLCTCLTSWGEPRRITQSHVNQIRIGQTTEPQLVELFGTPTTRFVDLRQVVSLDWFRSVPMSPAAYLPLIGELVGGLDVEAQQLTVFVAPNGRVMRYEVHSSKNHLQAVR